ncbi:hypothetical protein D081_0951 [Anaerovibrio sp. JC8]|nr:hypothetical protein D081_0951 [Anaerovibrio sp. JC8]
MNDCVIKKGYFEFIWNINSARDLNQAEEKIAEIAGFLFLAAKYTLVSLWKPLYMYDKSLRCFYALEKDDTHGNLADR